MGVEGAEFFGDRVGFDGIVTAQGRIGTANYYEVFDFFAGDRPFEILAHFPGDTGCFFGS